MPIVIVGNSGAARECYWLLDTVRQHDNTTPAFKGFLAWKGFKGNLCELENLQIGSSDDYPPADDDLFVIGMGKANLRMEVYAWLTSIHARFYTLKHPDVYICPSAHVGEANIFQRGCSLLANANIGNANFLNGRVVVGHDAAIGDCNVFNLETAISGSVTIGNANQFAPRSLVLEHAKMGDHNIIAPSAVVFKGCKNNCLMAGNPALVEGCHA